MFSLNVIFYFPSTFLLLILYFPSTKYVQKWVFALSKVQICAWKCRSLEKEGF